MAVPAKQVGELRKLTGCALLDCKKALEATKGDKEAAIKKLREQGANIAAKKSGRKASEGSVLIKQKKIDASRVRVIMLEVNCETDFVARDSHFREFVEQIAHVALEQGIFELDALLKAPVNGETVEELRQALVGQVGENIVLKRIHLLETDRLTGVYVHQERIIVLVELEGGDDVLAKDLAMQIAATKPLAIRTEDLSEEILTKEREIYQVQFEKSGKPAAVMDKVIEGRLKKFREEVVLQEQAFIKNPDVVISRLLSEKGATVCSFKRFEIGEGI
jgi:elongation factor Ts